MLSDIVGQDKAINLLKRQLVRNRVPQAYLFVGPEGVGKKKTAIELAKILNCYQLPTSNSQLLAQSCRSAATSNFQLIDSCGTCISCRKITKGIHPDVHLIDFNYQAALLDEDLARQTQIKIDTIREVQKQISLKVSEALWKVFIVDNAEKLSQDASNCLLKTLEEPPDNSLIILISTVKFALPGTLVSRCQYVRFCELKDEDIIKILACPYEVFQQISKFAYGSVAKSKKILEQEMKEVRELNDMFNKLIASTDLPTSSMPLADLLEFSERMSKDRNSVENLLLRIIALLREKLSENVDIGEIIEFVASLRQSSRYNINSTLLTDVLLLDLNSKCKMRN